jgi:hypothetical protein
LFRITKERKEKEEGKEEEVIFVVTLYSLLAVF